MLTVQAVLLPQRQFCNVIFPCVFCRLSNFHSIYHSIYHYHYHYHYHSDNWWQSCTHLFCICNSYFQYQFQSGIDPFSSNCIATESCPVLSYPFISPLEPRPTSHINMHYMWITCASLHGHTTSLFNNIFICNGCILSNKIIVFGYEKHTVTLVPFSHGHASAWNMKEIRIKI